MSNAVAVGEEFQLLYKDLVVGTVTRVFTSDGAIFGIFQPLVTPSRVQRSGGLWISYRFVSTGMSCSVARHLQKSRSSMHMRIL
jgi:hypothetical protein